MLATVDAHDQDELLLLFQPRSAVPGQRVIRAGDSADGMYFITSGQVEVETAGIKIDLRAGAFFGEMALLTGGLRTADVTAVDYCQLLLLERRDFTVFMNRHPEVETAVQDKAAQRLEQNAQQTAP